MKKLRDNLLLVFLFVIPFILVYKAFFTSSFLVWGDAPYFYDQNLKYLFNLPLLWDIRGNNLGGDQSFVLWLFLPTFLFGSFNHFFNFDNNFLIRLIFYFPASVGAFLFSFLFIRKYVTNKWAVFLGSFLYAFNTYFLMVLDGGQLGVALAYGFFPGVVLALKNYLDQVNIKNFVIALFSFFIITNIDIRVSLLGILLVFILTVLEKNFRKIFLLFLIFLVVLSLDGFWLLPFLLGEKTEDLLLVKTIESQINIINSFLLYQPHFPLNEFGKLMGTPFYFFLLPLLIFGGLFLLKKDYKTTKVFINFSVLFLIFCFLAKGTNEPLGQIYTFISFLPFGVAFRDSTKFFIPLFLVGGVMISLSFDIFIQRIKRFSIVYFLLVFCYLGLLIYPAFLGNLTGTLAISDTKIEYLNLKNKLEKEDEFFRTLWFPEIQPLSFYSYDHPNLSANNLYKLRPFASMIDGSYDLFNFLHSNQLIEWFQTLGIKYLFFQVDERKKVFSNQDLMDRQKNLAFIEQINGFNKKDFGMSFPTYEISNINPHIYGLRKIYFVLGGDEVYRYLIKRKDFDLSNNGFIFVEDGIVDLKQIRSFQNNSVSILVNNKSRNDIALSLLKNDFLDLKKDSNWAKFNTNDYLILKDKLLQNNLRLYDYDFQKGMLFSTIKDEYIKVRIDPPSEEFYIALRFINGKQSQGIKVNYDNQQMNFINKNESLNWELIGPFKTNDNQLEILNMGGLSVVNTLAVIKKEDYENALLDAKNITENYQTNDIKDTKFLDENLIFLKSQIVNPSEYKVELKPDVNWLIFTDSYNRNWYINEYKINSLPIYGIVNGFYVGNKEAQDLTLYYLPQKHVKAGIIMSVISFITLLLVLLFFKLRKEEKLHMHDHKKTLLEIHEDVPADHYDKSIKRNLFQKYWHSSRFREAKKIIKPVKGRILDIGCHSGLFTEVIVNTSQPKEIFGIDVSPSAIKMAKKRIKNANFKVANAHKLPFNKDFFDAVFAMEVLEHIESVEKVLDEIRRVLRKNGYALLLVPTDNFLFKSIWAIWSWYYPVWQHAHIQSFTNSKLEEIIISRGFKINKVKTFNLGMLKFVEFSKDSKKNGRNKKTA